MSDLSDISLEELQAEVRRRRPPGHVRADTVSNISVNGHLIPAGSTNVLLPRELAEEMLRRGHVARPARRSVAQQRPRSSPVETAPEEETDE